LKAVSVYILITAVFLLLQAVACDEDMYYEPNNYPRKIIFKGMIYTGDMVPVEGIRMILSTPDNLNHDTVYSDSLGNWLIDRVLEFAGPNKMRIDDLDAGAHGGTFSSIDTSFYINRQQYDSSMVRMNFKLAK
jgi:hypothetical protein